MLLSLRKSIVFEFTLFPPRICFIVFGLEPSKNLSFKLARLGWRNQIRDASQSLHELIPQACTQEGVPFRRFSELAGSNVDVILFLRRGMYFYDELA